MFSSNNGGLVDDGVNLAHTVQRASVFVPAVERLFAGRVFLDSSRTPQDRTVVLSNDSSHIRHATVACLESVLVEYFVQFRAPGEMLPDQGAELSANVRCHILAKRGVEPCDLPWSVPPLPSHSALPFFKIFSFFREPACHQRVVVEGLGIGEGCLVTRYVRETAAD